jgi:hypothetical protein
VAQKAFPTPSKFPSASPEHPQDFSEIVVPITSVKFTPMVKLSVTGRLAPTLTEGGSFGTGFCLDAACRFVATNYHVALTARPRKIKGEKIFERYFATGPRDKDATANAQANGDVLPYAVGRDLAIFELRRPLSHHHGLTFSLDELEVGQEVEIYGYPKGILNPIRKLIRIPAKFKGPTTSGLLAFDCESDKQIRLGGASGGIVVDRKSGKIVGILSGSADSIAAVLAVPVRALADFLNQAQPFLAQKLFPTNEISRVSGDIFAPVHTVGLLHRVKESPEVQELRSKAQRLADSMRDFIAVQTYEWGSGDKEPTAEAEYEVRVIDGYQQYREYPEGTKELAEAPYPRLNGWVNPADEWTKLPKMIATDVRLKVNQAADVVANERPMKVFQYYASVEDNLCPFAPVEDFGFFTISKAVEVACYGEVWTDDAMNILRISEHLDFSDKLRAYRGWEECQVVVTYGWIKIGDEPPRLVPLTIFTEARRKNHVYWCRGHFTNYQIFDSRVRIVAN